MSTTIDQRILEMRFDNKQFEANVAESIGTLGKLEKALKLDKFGDTVTSIMNNVMKVDFSPITGGVDTVIAKFNILEMAAVQALSGIITNGINKLQNAVHNLTLEQPIAGWNKFEQKTGSVQTIMAATGKSIDEVSKQLDRLNWFSDETSYSFTDMTSNVGKFTSVGVDLEKAVSAMEGISTWAALSGGNSAKASRAMYNLSQAMGVGSVKLMDWRSIENAGMATSEFKQTALEAAVAVGTLTKSAEGLYKTAKGTEVTVQNFSSTLSEGWFSADALMRSLDTYGAFANELSKASQDLDVEAMDLIAAVKNYDGSAESLKDLMEETGMSAEQLMPLLDKLTSSEYELGRKAFYAAQEAKTFSDVMDATKDAVSTKWMNIFEILFGNYEQAKVMFTEMAEIFYDMFADPVDSMKDFLKTWSEWYNFASDGSKRFMSDIFRTGITDFLWGIDNVLHILRSTLEAVIPPITVERLAQLTVSFGEAMEKFEHFTADFSISERTTERLRSVWSGLTAVFDIFGQILIALKPVMKDAVAAVKTLADDVLGLLAYFGDWVKAQADWLRENEIFQKAVTKLRELLTPVTDKVKELYSVFKQKIQTKQVADLSEILGKIQEKLAPIWDFLKKIFDAASEFFSSFNITGILSDVWTFISNIGGSVAHLFGQIDLTGIFKGLEQVLVSIGRTVKDIFKNFNIGSFLQNLGNGISSLVNSLGKADLSNLFSNLTAGSMVFGTFNLGKFFGNAADAIGSGKKAGLKGLLSPITDIFGQLKETIGSFTKDTDAGKLKNIAVAIGILTAALFVLSGLDIDSITSGLTGLGGTMFGMYMFMENLGKMDLSGGKKMKNAADAMLEISAAAWVLSKALIPFANMETEQLIKAGSAMTVIFGEMLAFIALFGDISRANTKGIFERSNGFDKQLKNAAKAMIELGAAIWVFAQALKPFTEMSWEQLGKAGSAMTVILGEMLGWMVIANGFDGKKMRSAAFAMIELGIAMELFALSVSSFAKMNTEQLAVSIGMMTAVLIDMGMFMFAAENFISSAGKLAAVAASMILLGVAFQSFAVAAMAFALMPLEGVNKALEMMTVITAIGAVFGILSDLIPPGGFAAFSAGLILLAAAFQSFAVAGLMLTAVSWESLGKLGAVFTVISVAMALMAPILPAIGAGLTAVGVGLIAIGGGITLIGVGIAAITSAVLIGKLGDIADRIIWIGNNLVGLFDGLRTALTIDTFVQILGSIPKIVTQFISGFISGLITGIGDILASAGTLFDGLKTLIFSFLDFVGEVAPKFIDTALTLVLDILTALSNNVPQMLGTVVELFLRIFDGLIEYVPRIVETLVNLLVKVIDSLAAHIPTLLTSFMNFAAVLFGDLLTSLDQYMFGGQFVEKLGDLIGRFVGGIIEGIGKAIAADLPGMGTALSEFMENLKPFIEGVQAIDESTMNAISALATAILTLSAADLISGIASFIGGKADLSAFGEGLVGFAPKFREFADIMRGIDTAAVSTASEAIKNIAEAFDKNTFKTGGLVQWFSGETKDLENFGNGLVALGPMLKQYAESVRGLDVSIVENSTKALEALTILSKLPRKGGVIGELRGDSDLVQFAIGLGFLGPHLMTYADSVKGLDAGIVTNSVNAAEALTKLASGLPSKSLVQRIFGGNDMDDFLTSLLEFGKGIGTYFTFISAVDVEQMTAVTAAVRDVLDLTSGKGEIKATIDKSFGSSMKKIAETGINDFIQVIVDSGNNIQTNARELIAKFIAAVQSKTNDVKNTFSTLLGEMIKEGNKKKNTFKSLGTDLITDFILGFKSERNNVIEAAKDLAIAASNSIADQNLLFFNSGVNAVKGFISGMLGIKQDVLNAGAEVANAASGSVTSTLKIQSPSRVFYGIGSYAGEGFVNGLLAWLSDVSTASGALGESALVTMSGIVEDFLAHDLPTGPVIRPVLDLTDVEAGSRRLNDLFSRDLAYSLGNDIQAHAAASEAASIDNSRMIGDLTFNVYTQSTDAKGIARELGRELDTRLRLFSNM